MCRFNQVGQFPNFMGMECSSEEPVLSRHRTRLVSRDVGLPAGLVHGRLLQQPAAGRGGPAAADSQRARGEPAGLGGSRVAGPAGQSGFPGQLGSLCFSSASSGETPRGRWSESNPSQCWVCFGKICTRVCTCVCACTYICVSTPTCVHVCVYAHVFLYVMVRCIHLCR